MLWAITSLFNPAGYRARVDNFHHFRRRLGLPLVVVELSFDGGYALSPAAAEIYLPLHSRSVLWHKEGLLNIALQHLPEDCSSVMWVDADVFFHPHMAGPALARAIDAALDVWPLIQPFSRVHHLPPGSFEPDAPARFSQTSLGWQLTQGAAPAQLFSRNFERPSDAPTPGYAWACRRTTLGHSGLYTGCIVGGGDKAMACAALDMPETVIDLHAMNRWQQSFYRDWAARFREAIGNAAAPIGALDTDIHHLYHGEVAPRRLRARHADLGAFDFDPYTDLRIDPATGTLAWASDKPDLHAHLRGYFAQRNEDDRRDPGG